MGKRKPRGEPVLSLSASADSTSAGQKAVLQTMPEPIIITLDDVPEFQEEARQKQQASQANVYLQVFMIGGLIFRWFKGRNKGKKPTKPRTPPSNN